MSINKIEGNRAELKKPATSICMDETNKSNRFDGCATRCCSDFF